MNLTKHLYYQNLDNNSGVFFRLLDEAEEQEFREAALAYFLLWKYAEGTGWSERRVDEVAEEYLQEVTGIDIDFEVDDALAKLKSFRFDIVLGYPHPRWNLTFPRTTLPRG